MEINFSEVFRDIVTAYSYQADVADRFTVTILVPPDHAKPISKWHYETVEHFYYTIDPDDVKFLKFHNPGDKVLYRFMGVKLEIILAAHADHASKAYLDAVKKHEVVISA